MKNIITKVAILLIFFMVFSFTASTAFSFFDNLNKTETETIVIGEWWTPISSTQEFYNMAISCDNDTYYGNYYLTQDINFEDFDWIINSSNANKIFNCNFDGNNKKIHNLTIYTERTEDTYLGIFSVLQNSTIKNLTLENVHIDFYDYALYKSNYKSGIIAGKALGENNIENITIIDSSVKGTKYCGVGGLIGIVDGFFTSINIDRIKASNFKIFSKNNHVGGLIGYIDDDVVDISISNIDFEGEIFSYGSYSFVGGLIGKLSDGPVVSIDNVIIEFDSINTIETHCYYYNKYTRKYIGGLIGCNYSNDKLTINNSFLTGSLITECSCYSIYVGTLIAKNCGNYLGSNNFYAAVLFKHTDGLIYYDPDPNSTGVFSTEINDGTLPTINQWNDIVNNFDSNIWSQDETGRLYIY